MDDIKKIHFVGVGGVGMGSFATALAEYGYEVSGSDGALYEPMKSVLANAKIQLIEGFSADTLTRVKPDAVIIGNVVRKDNAEASAWIRSGIKFLSFPEAVRTLLLKDRKSIVCAGTHGKTTTTSWIAFLLQELGAKPSYLIGGVPKDLKSGCLISDGELCVVEGDEYDSAFFDKGPKFLHYNPHIAVITSIEFDHADIYRDLAHVKSSFEKLIALLPGDGLCVARFDDPVVMEILGGALCPVQTFGLATGAMWRLGKVEENREGFVFEVIYKGRSVGTFKTPMFGEHNLMNILSGIVVAINSGFPMDKIRPIVERFTGAKRRQEILMHSPITLVDDFAHHPTEVAASVSAVRRRYPEGTLWALFEPRSATARRNVHQEEYAKAFAKADQILLASPYRAQELNETERFSTDTLVTTLKEQGKNAQTFDTVDEIVDFVIKNHKPGDIVLVMSNGEFGKIQKKITEALAP
jgi:UDP-N-acetylmuramate: L-alanyl-gamma-D-glutamyl-meso-diaminopimelate ligase